MENENLELSSFQLIETQDDKVVLFYNFLILFVIFSTSVLYKSNKGVRISKYLRSIAS